MRISEFSCALVKYSLTFTLKPSWAPDRIITTTSCQLAKIFTGKGITTNDAGTIQTMNRPWLGIILTEHAIKKTRCSWKNERLV